MTAEQRHRAEDSAPLLKGAPAQGPGEGPGALAAPVWVVSYPGHQAYRAFWDLQRRLWRLRLDGKIPDTLLLLEHEPVVTLGKSARREHLLLSEPLLRDRGVDLVEVDRGGDVTYHGPGQLVGYWIFDLRALYQDVHRYLREIEESLIRTLAAFGIEAGRSAGATGVWVGGAAGPERKVAAMGMHLSHWVSTHGFALNLNTDLTPFSWIVPCGLHGRGVTSMRELLGRPVERAQVEETLISQVQGLFHRAPTLLTPRELADILLLLERGAASNETTQTDPRSPAWPV